MVVCPDLLGQSCFKQFFTLHHHLLETISQTPSLLTYHPLLLHQNPDPFPHIFKALPSWTPWSDSQQGPLQPIREVIHTLPHLSYLLYYHPGWPLPHSYPLRPKAQAARLSVGLATPSDRAPQPKTYWDGCFCLCLQLAQYGCVFMWISSDTTVEIAQLAWSTEVWMVYWCVLVCVRHILSPLVVFCKSLSHLKPVLPSDMIDLHESAWGTVKKTRSGRESKEDCTIILSKIRRRTAQSHLNNKKVPFKGVDGAHDTSHNRRESSISPIVELK